MDQDRESFGKDSMAGTSPGIPDDALAPSQDELPTPPSEEEVERIARVLHAPIASKSDDTSPLEGE